jgi:hypothetical protein
LLLLQVDQGPEKAEVIYSDEEDDDEEDRERALANQQRLSKKKKRQLAVSNFCHCQACGKGRDAEANISPTPAETLGS